jgi:hypothetical protein
LKQCGEGLVGSVVGAYSNSGMGLVGQAALIEVTLATSGVPLLKLAVSTENVPNLFLFNNQLNHHRLHV